MKGRSWSEEGVAGLPDELNPPHWNVKIKCTCLDLYRPVQAQNIKRTTYIQCMSHTFMKSDL